MYFNRLLPAVAILKYVAPLYQPIFNVSQRIVVGFEALACCTHPKFKEVSLRVCISLARRNGLLDDMTINLCEQAALDLGELEAIHINVELSQLAEPLMVDRIIQSFTFCTNGLRGVTFEVNQEGGDEVSYSRALEGAERLKNLGAQLALDDFGNGHSNL